jgi:predicted nucleotidyltransferase component of viral defense system
MFSEVYLQSKSDELKTSFENLARESLQLQVLDQLSISPAGDYLAFKGGTALHYALNSRRFSEDLDFALLEPIADQQKYFEQLVRLCSKLGTIKDQKIKYSTMLVQFARRWENFPHSIFVKIEISLREVLAKSKSELAVLNSVLDFPLISFQVEKKEILMADKIAALLARKKARDLYDLLFLMTRNVAPNIEHVNHLLDKDWRQLDQVWTEVLVNIQDFSQQEINTDLYPFLDGADLKLLPELKDILIKKINTLFD